ncbi:hypothetical protein [Shimazuella kribbensis]|uniref:hypothetical protein n=1 Tax=Shimazuella kribbensis TaxID=139808 RepID=UPI000417AB04|nr:hypothetical protein [Shimazuella kribbensis]
MTEYQDPKKNLSFKQKLVEGLEEFKHQATLWFEDIKGNKKKLIPIIVVTIIGIFGFIRGLILMVFF